MSPSLRLSLSRDSSRCDGPQSSATSASSRVVHALSLRREKFRELRWLFVSRRRRWRSRHVFLLAKVISSGKRGWRAAHPSLLRSISSCLLSLVFLPRLSGARPYSNVRSGMHGGGREPNYLLWIGDRWRDGERLVVTERADKKVGRPTERRRLPFSFLFTRCSGTRLKISSKYQTASDSFNSTYETKL